VAGDHQPGLRVRLQLLADHLPQGRAARCAAGADGTGPQNLGGPKFRNDV
jgi:hypothetical protein